MGFAVGRFPEAFGLGGFQGPFGEFGSELAQAAGGRAGQGREPRREGLFQFGLHIDVFEELVRQVVGELGLDLVVLQQLAAGVDPVIGVERLAIDPDREDPEDARRVAMTSSAATMPRWPELSFPWSPCPRWSREPNRKPGGRAQRSCEVAGASGRGGGHGRREGELTLSAAMAVGTKMIQVRIVSRAASPKTSARCTFNRSAPAIAPTNIAVTAVVRRQLPSPLPPPRRESAARPGRRHRQHGGRQVGNFDPAYGRVANTHAEGEERDDEVAREADSG